MTLIIKDNSQIEKHVFQEIKHLTDKIADKTLYQLENEGVFVFPEQVKHAEDLSSDQIILQTNINHYRSSNVMGFLGYKKEHLSIESRFSIGEHDYLFQYLLERVLDLPSIVDLSTDSNLEDQSLNLLMFLFPYFLKVAIRKGLFKTYKQNRYNNPNVKGRIDIAHHIRNNTPFLGNISYTQREFSCDNYVTELIRHTISYIARQPFGKNLLCKTKDEVNSIIYATPSYTSYDRQKILAENKKQPIRHMYYHEYRALQRLCIMILDRDKHHMRSGFHQIHGILFDGAWLWEEYINLLIGDVFYHPMNKGGKEAQRLFDKNTGLIYPDFISRDEKKRVIADAKYKPINNIGNKDYLQVLAYMFRFDAKHGFYLYPEKDSKNDIILHLNQGSTYEENVLPRDDTVITKYGFIIPSDAENYQDFVTQMNLNEKLFREEFISI